MDSTPTLCSSRPSGPTGGYLWEEGRESSSPLGVGSEPLAPRIRRVYLAPPASVCRRAPRARPRPRPSPCGLRPALGAAPRPRVAHSAAKAEQSQPATGVASELSSLAQPQRSHGRRTRRDGDGGRRALAARGRGLADARTTSRVTQETREEEIRDSD